MAWEGCVGREERGLQGPSKQSGEREVLPGSGNRVEEERWRPGPTKGLALVGVGVELAQPTLGRWLGRTVRGLPPECPEQERGGRGRRGERADSDSGITGQTWSV